MTTADVPEPRIGHREREQAVQALADHYASGRLDGEEYSQRVATAWEARTASDLRGIFHDLPDPRPDVLAHRPQRPSSQPVLPPPGPVYPGSRDPYAPWGREPRTGIPYSDKNKIVAGVLQLVLPFGIGRFYSGHVGVGVAQLLLSFVGVGVIWAFIDGIVLLAGNPRDPQGRPMRM